MRIKKHIFYILIAVIFIFTACDDNSNTKKIACVGDSITFGHGISNRDKNSYPAQLEHMLTNCDVVNFGVSGATLLKTGDLSYWKQNELDSALHYNPDIVIIMLGSNDSKPWNWEHNESFSSDYIELINKFKTLESEPEIYVCYPPPAFKPRWSICDSVIRGGIIPIISEIAMLEDLKVIDMYVPFEGKEILFPDYIHPDSLGASMIATQVASIINTH